MNKVTEAVTEINIIIEERYEKLKDKFEKVDFLSHAGYVDLKCYKTYNSYLFLKVATDHIGSSPRAYTGAEYQKRGGHKKVIEEDKEYDAKKQRIADTDGLIITFGGNQPGNTYYHTPHTYDLKREEFIKEFESHFLS